MNRLYATIAAGLLLTMFVACKPGTPSRYIQPDEMEDILVDYYMARAMAQQSAEGHSEREYNSALYTEAVFRKHGVTQALFDSSLVYYYTRADRFDAMCQRVSERLEEQALTMGASEGEIGKYARYNATGDTANVWADRTTALMMPVPPYNRWDFNIDADSTYWRGDQLMMMFMSDFMYQAGNKNAMIYMAAVYDDTVVSRNLRFSTSGLMQMRIPEDTTRQIKHIRGYFYVDGANENTTTTRLLFINSVQLIRFHTRKDNLPAAADSSTVADNSALPDSINASVTEGSDTIKGTDTLTATTVEQPRRAAGARDARSLPEGMEPIMKQK